MVRHNSLVNKSKNQHSRIVKAEMVTVIIIMMVARWVDAVILVCCLLFNLYRRHIRVLHVSGNNAWPAHRSPPAFSVRIELRTLVGFARATFFQLSGPSRIIIIGIFGF